MSNIRRALIALMAIGAVGALAAGTLAAFTASVTNAGSSFSTGTLVLSSKVGAGTACLSTGGGNTDTNANGACSALFNSLTKGPGGSSSVALTLKNEGSLASATFTLAGGSCTDADEAGETYHGTGSLCSTVELTIFDGTNCVYPAAAGACTPAPASTLTAFFGAGTTSLPALGAGSTYTITWTLPSSAGNTLQGRKASQNYTFQIST